LTLAPPLGYVSGFKNLAHERRLWPIKGLLKERESVPVGSSTMQIIMHIHSDGYVSIGESFQRELVVLFLDR